MNANFLLGLGLGWITAALLMMAWNPGKLSDYQLEIKARDMGMVYADEVLHFREDPAESPQKDEDNAEEGTAENDD